MCLCPRCFLLLVPHPRHGGLLGLVHKEGYVRTSSFKYSLKKKSIANKFIHLTNDGVQNKDENYGKFEAGNKVSKLLSALGRTFSTASF